MNLPPNVDAPLILPLGECRDVALVGGKAASLGRLLRARFPVPDGFVVTTAGCRAVRRRGSPSLAEVGLSALPEDISEAILAAYRALGEGRVAVRSSATAEDTADASMAGQYETYLDIQGGAALLDAVRRCWEALDSDSARAYLLKRQIDPAGVAMAVVVQRLVPADVAGVLFTTNPHPDRLGEMLIEAAPGLGEAVVSGRVQPDAIRVDRQTGRVLSVTRGDARQADRPPAICLRGRSVDRLWQLGRRVAEHCGGPQDIEWAIHDGQVYLLQARPITTLAEAETQAQLRRAVRRSLCDAVESGRGPWVLHNLAETLPHPTPLTWSVVGRFMSGGGGFGAMYRRAGFEPAATVEREGFLDRIAGRVYMDVSRAGEMFFADFPFVYDPEQLRNSPDASQRPPTVPRGSAAALWRAGRRLAAVEATLARLALDCDRQLRSRVLPEIAGYVAETKAIDLASLGDAQLGEHWLACERRVMDEFGPQLLLPSLICARAMARLEAFLAERVWDDEPAALAQTLASGGAADRTLEADAELYEAAHGRLSMDAWLAAHGHRGPGEFDLSSPRWRELPDALAAMAAQLGQGEDPQKRHARQRDAVQQRLAALEAKLSHRDRRELTALVDEARRYIAFREDGKDLLMRGYDLLRDAAREAGRRLELGDDVFYLSAEELCDALGGGFAPYQEVERRRREYQAEARMQLPRLIDRETLEAWDCPAASDGGPPSSPILPALAVSSGEATGPARIVLSPTEARDLGHGYILVCPSTDPAWTPLFVNAAGLVLECGGALSHGAVVAREMGLPAVVLSGATGRFRDGESIVVNGVRGRVGRAAAQASAANLDDEADPADSRIRHCDLPPPPGRKDRLAARARNLGAVVWTVFLLVFFFLPESWLHQPMMAAMDRVLWPLARAWGNPALVAALAAAMAALVLLVQRFLTDNRRLREVKRRVALLHQQARRLPDDAPRRAALERAASVGPRRTLGAAMVPVGLLLGPMVLPFVWLQQRMPPAFAPVAAGTAVHIVATVDGEWTGPVHLDVPAPIAVDSATPPSQSLPPLRATLERLLALYRQPRSDPAGPWELSVAPDTAREQTAADLAAYLQRGIPPQTISWRVVPPENWSGRFDATVSTEGQSPQVVRVAVGPEEPPAPRTSAGSSAGVVQRVEALYPASPVPAEFWRPQTALAESAGLPLAARLSAIDVPWLALYLVCYLIALALLRLLLRVA